MMLYQSLTDAIANIINDNKDMSLGEIRIFVTLYMDPGVRYNKTTLGNHLGMERRTVGRSVAALTSRGLLRESPKTIQRVNILSRLQVDEK